MGLFAIRIFASLLWRSGNPCLGLVHLPRLFRYKQHVLQKQQVPLKGNNKFNVKPRPRPPFRYLCFACRQLGLGKGHVQRVTGARVKAREKAWKTCCFRQSLRLSRQGASWTVLRVWKTQPRSRPQDIWGLFAPVVRIDQGPDTAARKQPEHCTQRSVQKDRRRPQPKRMSLTLRALISIAVILSCRERLVLSGAMATPQRREVSEAVAQGCDCQLARRSLGFYKCRMGAFSYLLGCRVGEASHPGPPEDQSGASLAQANLQFFQTWQTKEVQRSEAPPHKTLKTLSTGKRTGFGEASRLPSFQTDAGASGRYSAGVAR